MRIVMASTKLAATPVRAAAPLPRFRWRRTRTPTSAVSQY